MPFPYLTYGGKWNPNLPRRCFYLLCTYLLNYVDDSLDKRQYKNDEHTLLHISASQSVRESPVFDQEKQEFHSPRKRKFKADIPRKQWERTTKKNVMQFVCAVWHRMRLWLLNQAKVKFSSYQSHTSRRRRQAPTQRIHCDFSFLL